MRREYDFSKSRKNPCARMLKKQITIRIDAESINYFKKLSKNADIPYQNLINLYLRDCVHAHRQLRFSWKT